MFTISITLTLSIGYACCVDKNPYRHYRRADKNPYRHDRPADKNIYQHDRRADSQCLNGIIIYPNYRDFHTSD